MLTVWNAIHFEVAETRSQHYENDSLTQRSIGFVGGRPFGSKKSGFVLVSLPLNSDASVTPLLGEACIAITGLAASVNGQLFVACENEGSPVMSQLVEGSLVPLFSYRAIRKFVVDESNNIYMIHEPGWKAGITRYDRAKHAFSFANVGWISDLALAGKQLIVVRDLGNADLLDTRIDSSRFGAVEAGPVRSQAFSVDADSGSVWQIDDRGGPLAIYRNQMLMKSAAAVNVDLAAVISMQVSERTHRLILTTRTGPSTVVHSLALTAKEYAPLSVVQRSEHPAAPARSTEDNCATQPVATAKGTHIRVRQAEAALLFEQRSDVGGELIRKWRDERVDNLCAIHQIQYDQRHARLLFIAHTRAYRDIAGIDLMP